MKERAKSRVLHFAIVFLVCSIFAICCVPRANAGSCGAGSYSAVAGTVCDIGSLEFTFGNVNGESYSYDYSTNTYVYDNTYSNSDFTFAPILDGFTLSVTAAPNQSITALANGFTWDYAQINFSIIDLAGNLTGESSSQLQTATGTNASIAYVEGVVSGSGGSTQTYLETFDDYGTPSFSTEQNGLIGSPFSSGSGSVYAIYLYAEYGNSASGGPATYTFSSQPFTSTPEPGVLLLLSISLIGLVVLAWKFDKSRASARETTVA